MGGRQDGYGGHCRRIRYWPPAAHASPGAHVAPLLGERRAKVTPPVSTGCQRAGGRPPIRDGCCQRALDLPATPSVYRHSAAVGGHGGPELEGRAVRPPSGFPPLLTPDEAAELLRTSRRAVYSLAQAARLPGAVRIGRRLLVRRDELLAWLGLDDEETEA
jgi:excisionase family DNA binding protein